MANMLFANNCNTTLNGGITAIATSMVVTSATGFPAPTGSQYFYCTLADAATQTTIEIVKVTAVSGTTFTIVRGQDGTSGTAFASGAVVSLRLVRASLNDFPKLDETNTFTADQAITGQLTTSAGLATTSTFTATPPADGLVMDYATGYGRFSAFAGDGFQWYNAGVANTKLMQLSSTGVLTIGNAATSVSNVINGINSGTAGGADLNVQNNGTTIIDIGNYSRIFGGAYNAGAAIYSPSTINYYIGSASAIFGIASTGVSTTGTLSSSGTMTVYNGPTWNAAFQVAQTPACSIATLTNEAFFIGNAYYDSVGWKYTASKPAGYYNMANTSNGDHIWAMAPSGTAGAAVTWTEVMRLTNSGGNLLVGTTTATTGAKLTVQGQIATSGYTFINTSTPTTIATGVSFLMVIRDRGYGGVALVLYENNTTPVIISQVGTVFTTSSPTALQIQLANLSGGSGVTALAGSSKNADAVNVSILQNQ